MNIKKIALVSLLSSTAIIGGCNLFSSKETNSSNTTAGKPQNNGDTPAPSGAPAPAPK